ncbi:hypothetical protein VNO78_31963 [Psophocarpus tetragonolobus]|uniref:Uncharacterized protein n=1 Tax=Psophocarpus tetragonolobus TaxID=3891 RepID=A0AAN9RZA4_PSOTE
MLFPSMANSEVPSFSLGLDTPPHSPIQPSLHVSDSDSDPESRDNPPRPILKRLRRGPPPPSLVLHPEADDDIEQFSSQDDPAQVSSVPSAWNRSVCSTSKVSLKGSGVLTPLSCTNSSSRDTKITEPSDHVPASASATLDTRKSAFMFPKLTTSPLRRFQLLHSDSDSDSDSDSHVHLHIPVARGSDKVNPNNLSQQDNQISVHQNRNKDPHKDFLPVKNVSFPGFELLDSDLDDSDVDVDVGCANKTNPNNHSEQNKKASFDVNGNEDLWKNFLPVENVSVPTPAFNEFCEEYFHSAKDKEVGGDASKSYDGRYPGASSSCQRNQQQLELMHPVNPAHSYFFHEDPRIRQLVHSRLRNFNPLGTVNRVNQQPNVSHIDYMGQFGNGEDSNNQGVQNGCGNSTVRRRNKSSNLTVDGSFNAFGGWVDPKVVSPFSLGESSRKKATKRNSTKNSSRSKNKANNNSNPSNLSCPSGDWVEPRRCTTLPKDAGKRRVQASGQSAGHWYTSPEGRKVYVNKSGQELTGQSAYRQYRKESGAGYRKSKKKTGSKKANAKKRN